MVEAKRGNNVAVEDNRGNFVAGKEVNFAVDALEGSFSQDADTSDANGLATTVFTTSGTVGQNAETPRERLRWPRRSPPTP